MTKYRLKDEKIKLHFDLYFYVAFRMFCSFPDGHPKFLLNVWRHSYNLTYLFVVSSLRQNHLRKLLFVVFVCSNCRSRDFK